jgi:hypothetical protein
MMTREATQDTYVSAFVFLVQTLSLLILFYATRPSFLQKTRTQSEKKNMKAAQTSFPLSLSLSASVSALTYVTFLSGEGGS